MIALARAAEATRQRPSLWIVALCGFLVRGGIVLFALPVLRLPSTVGMATLVGPTSVTAAGLTPDSVVRVGLAVGFFVAWLLVGHVVGALTDTAIVSGFGGTDPAAHPRRPRRIARLVAIRLASLLPLAVVVAVTARPVGELVYQELILPHDIATPLLIRVVEGAQVQVAALVVAWVVGEVFGGIAVRLAIMDDRSFGRAIVGAFGHVVRRPITTIVDGVVATMGLLVVLGAALLVAAAAWTSLAIALSGPIDGSNAVRATILMVVVWAVFGTLAGIVATWRGALWTAEVARARPAA